MDRDWITTAYMLRLLREIRSCGISYTTADDSKYHEVPIPIALWDEIGEVLEAWNGGNSPEGKDVASYVTPRELLNFYIYSGL